jgi:hypothetical protein
LENNTNTIDYDYWDWCDVPHKYMPSFAIVSIVCGAYAIVMVQMLYFTWSLSRPAQGQVIAAKVFYELYKNEIRSVHIVLILSLCMASITTLQYFMFKFSGSTKEVLVICMMFAVLTASNLINVVRQYFKYLQGAVVPAQAEQPHLNEPYGFNATSTN